MRGKDLYEKMTDIDNDIVLVAGNTTKTRKPAYIKWGSIAACLLLVCAVAISLLTRNSDDVITTPGIADVAPMVYVNGNLYRQNTKQIAYESLMDDLNYLGKVESYVADDQGNKDGVPKENFQSNTPIVGAEIYQYGDSILIHINSKYWLYEVYDEERSDQSKEGLSEQEKMEMDPSYNAE